MLLGGALNLRQLRGTELDEFMRRTQAAADAREAIRQKELDRATRLRAAGISAGRPRALKYDIVQLPSGQQIKVPSDKPFPPGAKLVSKTAGGLTPGQELGRYMDIAAVEDRLIKELKDGNLEQAEVWAAALNNMDPNFNYVINKTPKKHGIPFTGGDLIYTKVPKNTTAPTTSTVTTGTKENPATPQTEADFNKLPSGAYYIDPEDGQLYRK